MHDDAIAPPAPNSTSRIKVLVGIPWLKALSISDASGNPSPDIADCAMSPATAIAPHASMAILLRPEKGCAVRFAVLVRPALLLFIRQSLRKLACDVLAVLGRFLIAFGIRCSLVSFPFAFKRFDFGLRCLWPLRGLLVLAFRESGGAGLRQADRLLFLGRLIIAMLDKPLVCLLSMMLLASLGVSLAFDVHLSASSAVDDSVFSSDGVSDSALSSGRASDEQSASPEVSGEAGDCVATIEYYENVTYEEPGVPPNSENRYLMGTRTIEGLSEGQVLDAWDYVVRIDNFIFFDGWPGKLTVSSNPEENVIKLFYIRLWQSSYTVNYYMMYGADLTADNWSDALAPDGVEFVKFASETFSEHPYGELVKGDAYEYRLDGSYVVDAYPPQIRLGGDADNNVINILYVPDSVNLPDDYRVDDAVSDSGPDSGSGDSGSAGDGSSAGGESSSVDADSGGSAEGGSSGGLPPDQSFSKAELEDLLPDEMSVDRVRELFRDFLGDAADRGELDVTDEMLADTISPEEAEAALIAFGAGYEEGKRVGEDSCLADDQCAVDCVACIVVLIVLLVLCIVGWCLYARQRRVNGKLEGEMAALDGSSGSVEPGNGREGS